MRKLQVELSLERPGGERRANMHPDLDLHGVLQRAYREDMEWAALKERLLLVAERRQQRSLVPLAVRISLLTGLARAALEVVRGRHVEVIS
jgi:hypothetical protein